MKKVIAIDNLRCARFARDDRKWEINKRGNVVATPADEVFDIYADPRDLNTTRLKLEQMGYKFKRLTRSGKPHWKVSKPNGVVEEHRDLETLIVRAVEEVNGR